MTTPRTYWKAFGRCGYKGPLGSLIVGPPAFVSYTPQEWSYVDQRYFRHGWGLFVFDNILDAIDMAGNSSYTAVWEVETLPVWLPHCLIAQELITEPEKWTTWYRVTPAYYGEGVLMTAGVKPVREVEDLHAALTEYVSATDLTEAQHLKAYTCAVKNGFYQARIALDEMEKAR